MTPFDLTQEAADLRARLGQAERERDEAQAACVVLREGLESLVVWAQWAKKRAHVTMDTPNSGALATARDLLSSSSPGAGWIGPEVVKEVREALEGMVEWAEAGSVLNKHLALRDADVVSACAALAKLPKEGP